MWGGVLVGASFLLFIFFNFMSNMTAFWWILQQNICLVLTLETFQWDSEGSHIVMLPMSTHNKCLLCVSLPLGAIGWSVVCDCGIFWAYFFVTRLKYGDYRIYPKISSAHLPHQTHRKIWTGTFTNLTRLCNIGMTTSENPDQTRPSWAVWSGLTLHKLNI